VRCTVDPGADVDVPAANEVRAGTRWLLTAFAVLTLLAVLQLLLLSDVADQYWAWSIRTELTAAFLGAAYGAGCVLSFAALREHDWRSIRVPLLTVTAFTWLTAVPTLIHLHRLHLVTGGPVARAVAWVWLAVYLVIPIVCVVVVVRQELTRRARGGGGTDVVLRPMPLWLTMVLAAEGTVLACAGVVLYVSGMTVHHHEPTDARFWPWALMPLSAQVVGAWLIALALATALAVHQRDLSRLRVAGMTYTAFGAFQVVAVAWYWPQLDRHGPGLWGYLVVLAAMIATGGYGWWTAGRPTPDDAPHRSSVAPDPAGTHARRGGGGG
jgi:uncharacterized integral membrane protein